MVRETSLSIEAGNESSKFDDDGRLKRTGFGFRILAFSGFSCFWVFGFHVSRVFAFSGFRFSVFAGGGPKSRVILCFSDVLVEIQDTIKSGAESESKVMKKATLAGISVSTVFYMLCGILGYAAFGNNAPGNMLTGFGFYEPFWLVGLANLFIVIHLIGAYQVLSQPIFGVVEDWIKEKRPKNKFLTGEYSIFKLSLFRLTWRTSYVIFTTTLAMLFPFFNDFVGLIGAITFWPLTVYFPIEIYLARSKIPRFSFKWIWMRSLSGICLVVSLLAAAGSIEGLVKSLGMFKPFHSVS
ncbi:PREDICTED: amino acid permease 6-like [Erythranthe guttata]|nr:PREDICTED: amino acid permease 6-like [Erythranthe guttata]|eukprot:XP_012835328.1 PREDICTED: amino acid permease 6-like [Erythranthe guttata]